MPIYQILYLVYISQLLSNSFECLLTISISRLGHDGEKNEEILAFLIEVNIVFQE